MLETQDVARFFDVSRPLVQRMLAGEGRRMLRAVDGISFSIPKGTTLSLVGESGCGKSTVARLVVGLYGPTRGKVIFDGRDLAEARADSEQRRRMQMIFQDPYASLNPRWRVRDIIAEPIRAFGLAKGTAEIEARVAELLTHVGLSPLDGQKFPHEFSGGQRQRISIARALSSNPEFLVCDEPTSALADGSGAGPGDDRAPAHPGRRRGAEPDRPALRLPLPSALSAGERPLPVRATGADAGAWNA
jgi:peptide/nickel transport system ATP-binding protein